MASIVTALRILWDALIFRVRRREANNLVATISLIVAFRYPWSDALFRGSFALVLNIFVYLTNDVFDIRVDQASPTKDQRKVAYLAEHRDVAVASLVVLGLLLTGAAVYHSTYLTIVCVGNVVLIVLYSGWFKHMPIVDVLAMIVWGAAMTTVGASPTHALSWKLLGLLALLSGCYEVIQVIRDEQEDRESGVVTTAVLLGSRRAAWIFRGTVVAAAGYGVVVIGSLAALALLVAALLPLSPERANRTWDLTRAVFGVVWLTLLAQAYLGLLA